MKPFNEDQIRRTGLPQDVMGLIHDLCYHVNNNLRGTMNKRAVENYVVRAQNILKKETISRCSLVLGDNTICDKPEDHDGTDIVIRCHACKGTLLYYREDGSFKCRYEIGQRIKWQGQAGVCNGIIKNITLSENSDYVLIVDIGDDTEFPIGVDSVELMSHNQKSRSNT